MSAAGLLVDPLGTWMCGSSRATPGTSATVTGIHTRASRLRAISATEKPTSDSHHFDDVMP